MAETDRNTGEDNGDLGLFFQAARRETPPLPDGLAARILGDADQVQAGFGTSEKDATGRGLWQQVMQMLGGWPSIGGLAAACAAGMWIGLAPPSFLPDPMQLVTGAQADIDLFGGDDLVAALSEEG